MNCFGQVRKADQLSNGRVYHSKMDTVKKFFECSQLGHVQVGVNRSDVSGAAGWTAL
jgi:hypothetical protein